MRSFIVVLLLVLLVGCGGDSRIKPDWIDTQSSDYPAERYLTGRGQGQTAALARDRARSDLAKVFEVAVSESSSERLQWQQGHGGNDGLRSSISRDISSQTSQVVKGVQIVETWIAAEGEDYQALAVLDRLQASNRLRAEIAGLDRETAQNIEKARSEVSLPEKISAAYNALEAQLQRRYPQKMLQIVDLTGNGLPEKYQLATLKSHFESLLDRWAVAIVVESDELGDLRGVLAGALANVGIKHLASEAEAAYSLRADIDSKKHSTADGWHWVRGTLRISLTEAGSDKHIGAHQWSYKAAARQAKMAEIRARDQLADMLGNELLGVLVEFGDVSGSSGY
jgi:hypothetical protein